MEPSGNFDPSLAMRWAVLLPVLRIALADDLHGVSVRVTDDNILAIDVDGDGSAIGFVAGLDGERPAQAAARLLDALEDDLPATRRCWGRPVPLCPREGHRHAMTAATDPTNDVLNLYCPDDNQLVRSEAFH
jgi:hypothetical protein